MDNYRLYNVIRHIL